MSAASNIAYTKALADKLRALPVFVLKRAAHYTFTRIIELNVNSGFDSGQAAANWVIDGNSVGGASFDTQKMLWGYGDVTPTAPVGYKTYYEGDSPGSFIATQKPSGNRGEVQAYQIAYAAAQIASMPEDLVGINIYNPIQPGFVGFSPGSDENYAENAFKGLQDLQQLGAESLAFAERDAKVILGDKNAKFS